MKKEEIKSFLGNTLEGIDDADLNTAAKFIRGKVRDIWDTGSQLLILTSDRVSAFDRVLATIPCKGEVLNGLSNYWFDLTKQIIGNHVCKKISSRATLVDKCEVLPVEVVVRGYLTGSAYRDYQAGKPISGIRLPEGMAFNQKFNVPLLTPSTKAERGDHDEPISSEEIVKRGLVEESLWRKVENKAMELYEYGRSTLQERGLILVDTKYEFGLLQGELVLVDEVHTPDSSRFWFQDTYEKLFVASEKQRKLDKEYLRQWLMEKGYMGEGQAPEISDDIRVEVAWRYIQAFELITGSEFLPSGLTIESEKEKILSILA